MKKTLLTILSFTFITSSFATTEVATFDSTKMKCGTHQITDGLNQKDLKSYKCEKFQSHKTDVVFWDDNSKKLVDCQVDKVGNVTLSKCSSK